MHETQAFGTDGMIVALGCRAVIIHRLQLLLAGFEYLLHIIIKLDIIVEQQQGKVHLVHPLADGIEVYRGLGGIHIALLTGDGSTT